jgi:anti-sigma28 factor (negative regulator of flagellin synthesis)
MKSSNQYERMRLISRQHLATIPLRKASIAQLRWAVRSAVYSVSAERVAENILREALIDRLMEVLP